MVVHNPNNWHWVDKNCLPWSKEYLDINAVNTTYKDENVTIVLESVESVTGDCDVTQRKGKVLCIYDLKLQFSVNVNDSTITITVPEFVHDQEEDEYVFEIVESEHRPAVRKFFVPVLREKLMKFQGDLISAHEKDVQHSS